MITPKVPLKYSGDLLAIIGFGSGSKWRNRKATANGKDHFLPELAEQITNAIKKGFTHIDTAEGYATHREVGAGIAASKFPREKLWITDKYSPWLWDRKRGAGPIASLTQSLKNMKLNYVDLYLLHVPDITYHNTGIDMKEAWRQMEVLKERQLARNIGVSNFDIRYLEFIRKNVQQEPVLNQIEFNAYLQQQSPGILQYCKNNGIVIEGYSPLTAITKVESGPLDPLLKMLAQKYQKTESQIVLRWVMQNNMVFLTTSAKDSRLKDSLDILNFELSPPDFEKITQVGVQKNSGPS